MENSMAEYAKQDEYDLANLLNGHFLRKGLPYVAKDSGGSGHSNDVLVEHKETKEPINDFEAKRSKNSRTDYGQFQVYFDEGWQYHETSKSTPITRHVFKIIKPQLDALVCGDFPSGPTMSLSETKTFWNTYEPDRTLSMISGDVVKLADFGSCRGIYSKPPFTEYISTRWYRPPECLLTDGYYNHKMDYWGIGCVFFEVLTLTPLFPGTNELD